MAMNRELIGKTYEQAEPFEVTPGGVSAYADATSSDIDAYSGDEPVAPPMYGVAFSFGALTAPVLDGDLNVDLMRLVHGEQDMRFVRPVKPGDVIRSVGKIADIQQKSSGELLLVDIDSRDASGETVLQVTSSLFVKAPRRHSREKVSGERAERDAQRAAFDALPQLFSATQKVAEDQSVRYAEASGDRNPIHVDDDAAKMAGLPGVILHGLCTMAFVHNALVRHFGGDPARVARLAVRFSKPVLMGDELTIDVRSPESGPLQLRVTNQHGDVVLDSGVAELHD
jgi:acyl dehydratase